MPAIKCAVFDCSSTAEPAHEYCTAHLILFAEQAVTIRAKLHQRLDAWIATRLKDYPEERRRKGAGLYISRELLDVISREAGSITFGSSSEGSKGLFVREFRKLINRVYS